jgi:hypothetical protein
VAKESGADPPLSVKDGPTFRPVTARDARRAARRAEELDGLWHWETADAADADAPDFTLSVKAERRAAGKAAVRRAQRAKRCANETYTRRAEQAYEYMLEAHRLLPRLNKVPLDSASRLQLQRHADHIASDRAMVDRLTRIKRAKFSGAAAAAAARRKALAQTQLDADYRAATKLALREDALQRRKYYNFANIDQRHDFVAADINAILGNCSARRGLGGRMRLGCEKLSVDLKRVQAKIERAADAAWLNLNRATAFSEAAAIVAADKFVAVVTAAKVKFLAAYDEAHATRDAMLKFHKYLRYRRDEFASAFGQCGGGDSRAAHAVDEVYMVYAQAAYDTRKYKVRCFDGTPEDILRFKDDFLLRYGREYASNADHFSLADTAEGRDEGGVNGDAIADPAEADLEDFERNSRLSAIVYRKKRLTDLHSHLLEHIVSPSLCTMIKEHCISIGQRGNGYAAWQCMLTHCDRPVNDLTVLELDRVWASGTWRTVGLDADTFSNMMLWAANHNAKYPAALKKTESEVVVKILSCFDPKSNLGLKAVEEHAAGEADRKFWRPAVVATPGVAAMPASRDLLAMQRYFDPLWRRVYSNTQDGSRGHQADGAMRVSDRGDYSDSDDDAIYYTADRARGRPTRRDERPGRGWANDARLGSKFLTLAECQRMNIQRCYMCSGHGHLSKDCANPPDIKISIETGQSLLGDAQRHVAQQRPDQRDREARPRSASSKSRSASSQPRGASSSFTSSRTARPEYPRGARVPVAGTRQTRGTRVYLADAGFDDYEREDQIPEFSDEEAGVDDEVQLVNGDFEDVGDIGGSGFDCDTTFACRDLPSVAAPRTLSFADHFKRLLCWTKSPAAPPPSSLAAAHPPAPPNPPPKPLPAPPNPPPPPQSGLLPPSHGCGRGPRTTPDAPVTFA